MLIRMGTAGMSADRDAMDASISPISESSSFILLHSRLTWDSATEAAGLATVWAEMALKTSATLAGPALLCHLSLPAHSEQRFLPARLNPSGPP